MTWTAKDRGLWLTLAALTVLLVVLAGLQYRWISEIGRAEAERRQGQLERATGRFAAAFDREISRVLVAFLRMEPGPPAGDERRLLLELLAAWRTNEHAGLVSQVLLATATPTGEVRLEACDAAGSAFHEVPWTPELQPLRQRLEAGPSAAGVASSSARAPFSTLRSRCPSPSWGGATRARRDRSGDLSASRASSSSSSTCATCASSFSPSSPRRTSARSRRASSSWPWCAGPTGPSSSRATRRTGWAPSSPATCSAASPGDGDGPGTTAPTRAPGPFFGERPPDDGRGRQPGRQPEDESPWLLVARHRGGSLELTVSRVRRRNLGVGLGILALLGATAALLATGAQRARRLARQQMEFVAGVTHELNTPLAAIRSAGQNLADGIVTDPAQVRRYGGLIEKEGGRLTALVAQVLDFAGIDSANRAYVAEPLSVARLVDEVLRDNRLALEQAGMTVERDVAPGLPEIRGDAAALRRALANLVANAVKFAAAGQWVAVRASARPDGKAVVLRVEDRGPGIPRDERERVFEPFYRGPAAERNATPGSGLGLSVVRHVVRAHGGSVHVEGREGGGTAVVVELPASPAGETRS